MIKRTALFLNGGAGWRYFWNLIPTFILLVVFDIAVAASSVLAARAYALAFTLFVPGAVLLALTPLRPREISVRIAWCLGTSVMLLMLLGLFYSLILPRLGIPRPLRTWPLAVGIDLVTVIPAAIQARRGDPLQYVLPRRVPSGTRLLAVSLLMLLPLGAIAGAERLNNDQGSATAFIVLIVVGLLFAVLVIATPRIPRWTTSATLYATAAATLLMSSMRSSYPYGYDIQTEYRFYSQTLAAARWHVPTNGNAYAAMLSITVLPVILTVVAHISGIWIFKLIYPLILSLFPTIVFIVSARWLGDRSAVVGGIVVVAQGFYAASITGLARQDIALLYFVLLIATAFDEKLPRRVRQVSVLVLAAGMAISHYSTAYFACIVLVSGYIIHRLLRLVLRRHRKERASTYLSRSALISAQSNDGTQAAVDAFRDMRFLSLDSAGGILRHNVGRWPMQAHSPPTFPADQESSDPTGDTYRRDTGTVFTLPVVAAILGLVYVWNVLITHSAQNIANLVTSVSEQGLQVLPSARGTSFANRFLNADVTPTVSASQFVATADRYYRQHDPWLHPYPLRLTQHYPVVATGVNGVVRNDVPAILPRLSQDLSAAGNELLLLLITAGVVWFAWLSRRYRREVYLEFASLALGCLAMLAILRTSATISGLYNAPRGQVQGAPLLSVGIALICSVLFAARPFGRALAVGAAAFGVTFLLFAYSGLSDYVLGGGGPAVLVNYGNGYQEYYITGAEAASAQWLAPHLARDDVLYADQYAAFPLNEIGTSAQVVETVIPSIVEPRTYVYASVANLSDGTTRANVASEALTFVFPRSFLDHVKNVVFSTGSTEIYY
jgi:uncharacterized membrane protein